MLVLVHPTTFADARELAKAFSRFGPAKAEDGMVVLNTRAAQEVANTFGVGKVSVALECENQLGAIAKSIAEVGRKTVLPGQRFYVKVRLSEKRDFTSRDIEFAATGALTAELDGVAKPVASEQEAQQIVVAYIGRHAFVCIKEYDGAGGAIPGSQGSASCAITGPQSLAVCLAAAKAGFVLELLLLYSNDDDLRKNARLARALAEKIGAKKQELTIARTTGTSMLAFDLAAARALARMKSKCVILPVSLATHPQWFIEIAMKTAYDAGKVPLAPLMFLEDPDGSWQDARKTPRKRLKAIVSKPKRVRLEVGPNYLHDIIDSV